MATYTADAAQNGFVRQPLDGEAVVVASYSADGRTISAGDVYVTARVPAGATITSLEGYGRSSGTGGIVFTIGYIAPTLTTLSAWGNFTISATQQIVRVGQAGLPFTVNISDDAAVQNVQITMSPASGTATATGTFGMIVRYTMPSQGKV